MPERQQISQNLWRSRQIAARNLTKFVDILSQQIGNRNQTEPAESDGRLAETE